MRETTESVPRRPVMVGGPCLEEGAGPAWRPRLKVAASEAEQGDDRLRHLEVDEIDEEDRTYCFRVSLAAESLAKDIEKNGQDVPVIVRRVNGREKYQLVCGFRRLTAIKSLGQKQVKALVRELTDDEAYRLSWSENERRRSYTSLDRANAILKAHRSGRTLEELETLFGLKRKQISRLKKMALAPQELQEALGRSAITTTHAVVLNELKRRYPELDLERWADEVSAYGLSVRQLRLRVNRQHGKPRERPSLITVKGEALKLNRGVLDLTTLTPEARQEALALGQRLKELTGQ